MFTLLMKALNPNYQASAQIQHVLDKSTMLSCVFMFLIFVIFVIFVWHKQYSSV